MRYKFKNEIASRSDICIETIEKKWPQDFVQAYKSKISERVMLQAVPHHKSYNDKNK